MAHRLCPEPPIPVTQRGAALLGQPLLNKDLAFTDEERRLFGLGAILAGAQEITDEMFLIAALTLAELVPADRLKLGGLYPSISALRHISRTVAARVLANARGGGPEVHDALLAEVDAAMWAPEYLPYRPA